MLSRKLLDVLACPKCKGELGYDKKNFLVCSKCRLKYSVKRDIPDFLSPRKF